MIFQLIFYVYIDSVLQQLWDSGLGRHIGCTFADALCYADDISVVVSYGSNLYAMEYYIGFNPVKSNSMCFNSFSSDNLVVNPYSARFGKPVDVVEIDLDFGNQFFYNIYTQYQIL